MARVKSEKVLVTFPTTTQAMKMESAARSEGLPGRLIPVPRQISAGCGMAFCAPVEERSRLEALLLQAQVKWEQIYELFL